MMCDTNTVGAYYFSWDDTIRTQERDTIIVAWSLAARIKTLERINQFFIAIVPTKIICYRPAQHESSSIMSTHETNSQYVIDLNGTDVLCGRGSGPNDRTGNIEFRNLVFSRKAEYLAATTRDAKGRIATEIVEAVRSRGGRFLKKISPAQAKDAGFKRGVAVYELADEPTVLEKAKQTLRQNRAEFAAKVTTGHLGVGMAGISQGGTAAACRSDAPTPISRGSGGVSANMGDAVMPENSGVHSSGGISMNPIPLGESASLDSMQRPVFSASTAEELNAALFASSVLNSMGGGGTNFGGNIENNGTNMLNQAAKMISSESSGGSLNTELASAIYSALAPNQSGGSSGQSNISAMSTNSVDAFEALIKEYNVKEQQLLKQQYDELKFQQQQIRQMKQQFEQQQTQQQIQQLQQQPHRQIQQLQQQFEQQEQHQQIQQLQQQLDKQQLQQQNFFPCNVTSSINNGSIPMQFIPEDHQTQLEPYDYQHQQNSTQRRNGSSNVFESVVNHYNTVDETMQLQQMPQQQQQGKSSDMAYNMPLSDQNQYYPSQSSNDTSSISFGSLADDKQNLLRQYEQDQSNLLKQYQMLQVQEQNSIPNSDAPLIEDSRKLCNNDVPNKLETHNASYANGPMKRRPSRGNLRSNLPLSGGTSQAMSNLKASSTQFNVEPANFQNVPEESLRLSFLTADRLAATLKEDMSNGSLGQYSSSSPLKRSSANTNKRRSMPGSFNASEQSMMSMMSLSLSLSEIDQDMFRSNTKMSYKPEAKNTPDNANNETNDKKTNCPEHDNGLLDPHPSEVIAEKPNEMARFGESSMSLVTTLEENWADHPSSHNDNYQL